ncbi:MAG: small subunit ribosomal protein S1 [Patiriisocius sp.]|jgi:small subunit ribosomal protein S1
MSEENKNEELDKATNNVENTNTESTESTTPESADTSTPEASETSTPEAAETKEEVKTEPVATATPEEGENEDSKPKYVERGEDTTAEPDLDFDWDAFEQGDSASVGQDDEDLHEAYGRTLTSIAETELLDGKITSVTKKNAIIDINYKSEGVISLNEFRYNPDLKAGDDVKVYVVSTEDHNGQLVLSHKMARVYGAWNKVNAVLETGEVVMGHVLCRTRGGLIVDLFGLEVFLPGSQIDVKPIRDYDEYVGKNMELKVVKINQEYKNVVVSHKALIEAELEVQKDKIMAQLEQGQVLEGVVKNITSYGVFVDLGGVDGLIHITDLSWGRISHPEEVVELDQKINVVILDFDNEKKRIALGYKQLSDHPWDKLGDEVKEGDVVEGTVVVLADYGAFVEIQPGIEGLLHASEMSWSQHLRSSKDFLKVGEKINAQILTLDRDDKKMSLGMKQLSEDPWKNIDKKYPVDSKHTSIVRNFTHFGIFVELEEGVDGLIHISDLSWQKRIKHPSEFCAIGDELEVMVIEVDAENRRLSLGHKQLEENPWDVFETVFKEDENYEGTVVKLNQNSAIVSLQYGMEAVCPKKHLRKEDGTNAREGEQLNFKILEFNKNAKKIVVSHLRTFEDSPEEVKDQERKQKSTDNANNEKAIKKMNKSQEKSTLGDLDVLSDLKAKMEGGKE